MTNIGTKESWAMICGKVGANAGPAFEAGGKMLWDNNKELFQIGGDVKVIGGLEIDGQFNWKKVKESF